MNNKPSFKLAVAMYTIQVALLLVLAVTHQTGLVFGLMLVTGLIAFVGLLRNVIRQLPQTDRKKTKGVIAATLLWVLVLPIGVVVLSLCLTGNLLLATRVGMLPLGDTMMMVLQALLTFIIVPLVISILLAPPIHRMSTWSRNKFVQA